MSGNASDQVVIGFIVQSTLHELIWSSEGLVHSDFNEQFIITNLVCVLQAAEQIKALYKLFLKVDATQVEINPFGETPDGKGLQHFRAKMLFYLEIVENGVLLNNVY